MPDSVDPVYVTAYPFALAMTATAGPIAAQFHIQRISETSQGEPPPPEPPIEPVVSSELADPANAAALEQARANLQANLGRISGEIATMVDGVVVTMPDGKTMTGAQLKSQWNRMVWFVTDASYGKGKGGAGYRVGRLIHIYLSLEGIEYYSSTEAGWNYMVFHEIGHWTASGVASNLAHYKNWNSVDGKGTYDLSDLDFELNEIFANQTAKVFTDALGIPIRMDVPFGY